MNGTLDLHALAQDVAAQLGPEWAYRVPKVDPGEKRPEWYATIEQPDGAGIHFGTARAPGRVTINGTWPRDWRGEVYRPHKDSPEITVSADRPAADIAREISRRFMPDYIPKYVEQLAWVERATQERANRFGNAQRIAEALGGIPAEDIREDGAEIRIYAKQEGISRLDVHADRVDIGLSLPVELAAEVLRLVAGRSWKA